MCTSRSADRDPFESVPRRRARPVEKGRDPYDGLRPWSAITHGVGAVLAALGTAVLEHTPFHDRLGFHFSSEYSIYDIGIRLCKKFEAPKIKHCFFEKMC